MIRNVICTLIGLPLLIYAGYAVILGLFTFRRRPPIPRAQRDSRLCVLCPARNEMGSRKNGPISSSSLCMTLDYDRTLKKCSSGIWLPRNLETAF